jgi:hypothetical protein
MMAVTDWKAHSEAQAEQIAKLQLDLWEQLHRVETLNESAKLAWGVAIKEQEANRMTAAEAALIEAALTLVCHWREETAAGDYWVNSQERSLRDAAEAVRKEQGERP